MEAGSSADIFLFRVFRLDRRGHTAAMNSSLDMRSPARPASTSRTSKARGRPSFSPACLPNSVAALGRQAHSIYRVYPGVDRAARYDPMRSRYLQAESSDAPE